MGPTSSDSLMRVSIVLTVLNEGDGMAELLEALLGQTANFDEIVVVDGGSRDETMALLTAYRAKDIRIKLHVDRGVNIARGRNLAIARALGDVIAVTDGGCRPDRDWLRELLAPLESDPLVGAVGGRFVPVTETRFEYYSGVMSIPDLASESQRGMFYGRSSAFRKQLWERVGGYPEWLYTAEDTLFAIGAGKLTDYRIVYAPASLLYWRPRPTLRKMAKMFYLYGKGNGRIQHGDLKGALYWLRYYAAFVAGVLSSPFYPWALLVAVYAAWHLFRTVAQPNLRLISPEAGPAKDSLLYVPLISLVRNLSTNLGFVRGWLEYQRDASFKQRLEDYLAGRRNQATTSTNDG